MPRAWTLTMDDELHERLERHLFPGDGDEHGAVIAAGICRTSRGTRLIARELHLAIDDIDFVPGRRGYKMLTAEFVRDKILHCRDEGLAYLAVHNHHGRDQVEFSDPDLRSHERGYPALLDISGQPVGALVFAQNAVAGDIWTPDRERRAVRETVILGRNRRRVFPSPPPKPPKADATYDRQARWFGDRGQDLLGKLKVTVIGAGGVGLPLITQLARLGVGHIVVIDPDRIEDVNLPRMPEATRFDARTMLRFHPKMEDLANRLGTRKIRVARRAVRRANRRARFVGLPIDVTEPEAAKELVDSDFIFLAADSHLARMLVNEVAHQYLVPAIQLGSRIEVDEKSGKVGEIRSHVRLVLPNSGCLRCNNLILPSRLQDEAMGRKERERNRYVDEVPAPSVITLNTALASQAATDFLLMVGGLIEDDAPLDYLWARPRKRRVEPQGVIANKASCRDCGHQGRSRRARGDGAELTLPER